jgi:hypothetical protein
MREREHHIWNEQENQFISFKLFCWLFINFVLLMQKSHMPYAEWIKAFPMENCKKKLSLLFCRMLVECMVHKHKLVCNT